MKPFSISSIINIGTLEGTVVHKIQLFIKIPRVSHWTLFLSKHRMYIHIEIAQNEIYK